MGKALNTGKILWQSIIHAYIFALPVPNSMVSVIHVEGQSIKAY